MLFRKRATLVAAISAVLLGLVTVPAAAADTSPATETATSLKPGDTYVISDPKLIADPQKAADTLNKDGDLDRLGIKPTSGPSAKPGAGTRAPWGRSYTVPSKRFPSGAKPADVYQYIKNVGECADNDDSGNDGGWIKNRYAYCQRHLIIIPAIQCGLLPPGCYLKGSFVARNTIIGKGKIGGWIGSDRHRWADFDLDVDVYLATGHFNRPGATMRAELEHEGSWEGGGGSAEDACDGGIQRGRTDSPGNWKRDGNVGFDLVSTAPKPPGQSAGQQIADCDFRPVYRFHIPGYDQFQPTEGEEGKLRFDSAWFNKYGKLGSVFSDTTPALQYDRSDKSSGTYTGVTAVADHIGDARANPDGTLPPKDGKNLPGAEPVDPLHRVVPAAGATQQDRYNANRNVVKAYCRSGDVPGGPGQGNDCDEYPFASSYEGAARYKYEGVGDEYKDDYTVRFISPTENQEAGRRLRAWYDNDRILDWDAYALYIGN